MPETRTVGGRIAEVVGVVLLIGATATGTVMIQPESYEVDEIRVAAFNIQRFGKSKCSKDDVMDVLADIASYFDIMVVQEVVDASQETPGTYLDLINDYWEPSYAAVIGPRLGRSSHKEQYVVYYVPAYVEFLGAYTLDDPDDDFMREPLVATFRSGNFDFALVVCHIKPDDVEAELAALISAVPGIRNHTGEEDIILLGDFNADGRYLNEGILTNLIPAGDFRVVITDTMVTTTKTEYTYDRIVLTGATSGSEYIEGSAGVFTFDEVLGIEDQELVYRVSDHYPVYAEFRTDQPDDDPS
jgi:endonuclease/exonuclease/phosphatase family metal-dependent hydrolase